MIKVHNQTLVVTQKAVIRNIVLHSTNECSNGSQNLMKKKI